MSFEYLHLLRERFADVFHPGKIALSAFCTAREKLFISYNTGGSDESREPSDVVERTRDLFPNHREIDYNSMPALDLIESRQTAFETLAREMLSDTELYRALRKYLWLPGSG